MSERRDEPAAVDGAKVGKVRGTGVVHYGTFADGYMWIGKFYGFYVRLLLTRKHGDGSSVSAASR